jgi:hypothetical protein
MEDHYTYDIALVLSEPEHKDHFPSITGPQIQRAIEAAGCHTMMYMATTEKHVILLVGAAESQLRKEAERIEYNLRLDPEPAIELGERLGLSLAKYTKEPDEYSQVLTHQLWQNLYGRFKEEVRGIYATHDTDGPMHRDSLFSAIDRIRLTFSILQADPKNGGAGLAIKEIMQEKHAHLVACFPLHDAQKQKQLKADWLDWRKTFNLPIEHIKSYFGESIAFYFAFLRKSFYDMFLFDFFFETEFYNVSLILLALLGIAFFGVQAYHGFLFPGKGNGVWVYGILVAIWCTII